MLIAITGLDSFPGLIGWMERTEVNPKMLMPFGKHKGSPLDLIPKDYLQWLLKKEVEELLAASSSRQVPLRREVPVPPTGLAISELDPVEVDWNDAASQLAEAIREAERILLDH